MSYPHHRFTLRERSYPHRRFTLRDPLYGTLLGNRELGEMVRAVHTRFWNVRPVAPEKEDL